MQREIPPHRFEGASGAGGEKQQRGRSTGRWRRGLGGLFQNDVRIRSADAERTHGGTPWTIRRPGLGARWDKERTPLELEPGVGLFEMERRRQCPLPEGEGRLDQTGYAGGFVEMAHVAL